MSSIDEITETGIIYSDDYIPNLFGVHPREKITSTEAYRLEIIIQDRASCFPSHILNADPEDIHTQVIDACAALKQTTMQQHIYQTQIQSCMHLKEIQKE